MELFTEFLDDKAQQKRTEFLRSELEKLSKEDADCQEALIKLRQLLKA